jgi:hypothetical protein
MKKFENLGKSLTKEEQTQIKGGTEGEGGRCGDPCTKGSTCSHCSGCDPDIHGKYVCTSHA